MNFKQIDISMKSMVEGYTSAWGLECSEYTFANLLMWGTNGRILLCEKKDTLFILMNWYGSTFMFAPLTKSPKMSDYKTALDTAADHMRKNGIEPIFLAISGPIKTAFEQCEGYSLREDRNNADYVYSTESLTTLSGKKLHAKRNHINKFMSEYGDGFEYVDVTGDMLDECVAVYNEWLSEKNPDETEEMELCAIKTLMTNMEELGIRGGGIRLGEKLVAFTLGQKINDNMAVVHIEKADANIAGLYTVINNQFVINALQDVRFINREEDMGLAGLRKAKLSYAPAYLIEKFEGRPNDGH